MFRDEMNDYRLHSSIRPLIISTTKEHMLLIFIVYLPAVLLYSYLSQYTEHLLMNLLSLIMIGQHLAGLRKSALCNIRRVNQTHTHPCSLLLPSMWAEVLRNRGTVH